MQAVRRIIAAVRGLGKVHTWFRSNLLLLRLLGLPTLALILAAATVAWYYDGFMRDLAADVALLLLGALVTVFFVDWAVAAHESARWEPFQGAADSQVRRMAAECAYAVEQAFNTHGPGAFMVPAWKMKSETGLWHLELVRDDAWLAHVRATADGAVKHITFDKLRGDHEGLINALLAFREQMHSAMVLYGRILTPLQLANAARLVEEIPPEVWLLGATQHEGANHPPANLQVIVHRALALIEDVNSRNDPKLVELPWLEAPVAP